MAARGGTPELRCRSQERNERSVPKTDQERQDPEPGTVEGLSLRHPGGETGGGVGMGAPPAARPELARWVAGRTLFVVTTPQVLALHGERLAPLRDAAAHLRWLEVPEGEAAKTLAVAERLWNE